MKNQNIKNIFGLVLGIVGLLIIIGFMIYFCIKFFSTEVRENDVLINSNEYKVIIKDKLSVSDEFGKTIKDDNNNTFGYLEFEVYNTMDSNRKYEIFTMEEDNELEINPSYVKLYLTNENDEYYNIFNRTRIPNYLDFKSLDDKPGSKLIYSGTLKGKETKKFKLRVWLTDSYVINNSDLSFRFEIGVRAV